jgi:hypothetical protein
MDSPAPATVSKGLATWLGIIAALGQYAGAVALFAAGAPTEGAITSLGTATATLVTLIAGRMYQGGKALEASASGAFAGGTLVTSVIGETADVGGHPSPLATRDASRSSTAATEPLLNPDPEPPEADPSVAVDDLDDPGDEPPTLEVKTHGNLMDDDDKAARHG